MMMGLSNISILSPASTISVFVVMAMAMVVSTTPVLVCLIVIIIPVSVRCVRSMLLSVLVSSLVRTMLMAMSVFLLNLSQSFLDLLFLLLDQIVSHGILLLALPYPQQFLQLPLLLDHGPLPSLRPCSTNLIIMRIRLFPITTSLPIPIRDRLILSLQPIHPPRVFILPLLLLIPCMINAQQPAEHLGAPKIIYSQIATALIRVLEKGEALAFSRFPVPDQV